MDAEVFLRKTGADFFVGVPDSQLRALCDCLMERYGIDGRHHVIAANEGTAAGAAAGYHLATGRVPLVYLQNSGEGNIVNALASLLHEKAYGIPLIFVIGWRGEPGVKDEPQHARQGEVTLPLLDLMQVEHFVLSKETTSEEMEAAMARFRPVLQTGRSVAFVVRKGALLHDTKIAYKNGYELRREDAIRTLLETSEERDAFISTTGKVSRELFELREERGEGHERDFLTIGSMGHSSSIALGIACQQSKRRIWCLDGDGAFLMHMGAAAVVASLGAENFMHILLNNEAHESVGGMPTAAGGIDFPALASALGYGSAVCVTDREGLAAALAVPRGGTKPHFIEVRCAIGSRADLGRPTTSPQDNKQAFMRFLSFN